MKAGWYESLGKAADVIQIGEKPTPEAGIGEVRVRIQASGVNPSDVKSRGRTPGTMPGEYVIPHSDGAGVIDQVGPGVDAGRVGQRVWVYNAQWQRINGSAAEYVTLPEDQVIPLSAGVSFAEGACLGIPAMTAHRAVFADGSVKGQTILVTGGAGAVGHYAIQFAKWSGATVITTVSGDAKADHAKVAGADHIINYRTEKVAERIMAITDGAGLDRIVEVDFGGNLDVTREVLKVGGTIACYASAGDPEPTLPFYALMYKNITIQLVLVYNMSDDAKSDACVDISRAINEGALTHAVAQTFPLSELAAAHQAVESGKMIGNVVVEI